MRERIPLCSGPRTILCEYIHVISILPSSSRQNIIYGEKMVCLLYQNSFKDRLFIHSHFQLDTLHKIGCSCIEVLNFYISLSDAIIFLSFYTCFNIVSPLSEVLICQFLCWCYILKTCLDFYLTVLMNHP